MKQRDPIAALETALPELVERLASGTETWLLFGPSGSGKSTLAAQLAGSLAERGLSCACLSADPGAPAFGVPAAVNLGHWQSGRWQRLDYEAVASLDAARFRLPLVEAVRRLLARASRETRPLIIDAPGLVRGVGAAELLPALVEATAPAQVVLLAGDQAPLPEECRALPVPVLPLKASGQARAPRRHEHRQHRSQLWQRFMRGATEQQLGLDQVALLGTPPPPDQSGLWAGAIIALGDGTRTLAMGEAVSLSGASLHFRAPPLAARPKQLLIRDAVREERRGLVTRPPPPAPVFGPSLVFPPAGPQSSQGPRITTRAAVAELVNGLFEDPLLLVQLRGSGRCLLFDLGESGRVPLRLLHRVSDVFISHGHLDHIGGFLNLLRARLGVAAECRLFGPPGLAGHIQGFLNGVLWDRIGENGPRFKVGELHSQHLHRFELQAGRDHPVCRGTRPCPDGVVVSDHALQVRAITLDHEGVPVLAYAFEPAPRLQVSKERLEALGWPAGPWLAELKDAQRQGDLERAICLPDGRQLNARQLSRELLSEGPAQTLVYATDLADTPDNRQRLAAFAKGAHSLFLEASFAEKDRARARSHGHLTTRACGEIGAAARVTQLVPFHFSRRYADDPDAHYREIAAAFGRPLGDGPSLEKN